MTALLVCLAVALLTPPAACALGEWKHGMAESLRTPSVSNLSGAMFADPARPVAARSEDDQVWLAHAIEDAEARLAQTDEEILLEIRRMEA